MTKGRTIMKVATKRKLETLMDEYNMSTQLLSALLSGKNDANGEKGVMFWSEYEDVGVKKGKDGSLWVFNSEGWRAKVRDERVVGVLDELTGK